MAYLVRRIKHCYPKTVKLIKIPSSINLWPFYIQQAYFYTLAAYLNVILKSNDKLLFTEYLGNVSGNQTGLAIKLRNWGLKNKIIGLVHLSGENLLELYGSNKYIHLACKAVDNIIVFGSKLADFFSELGYEQKVIKTFHYVDINYYKPSVTLKSDKLKVIHMGSIKRNFEQLFEIVKACPDIDFHICQGYRNLSAYFKNQINVKLYGYLKEAELLELMQSCHISLSVLDDTVGSNVITTSMACGLVNVVSDAGSIRDYCELDNSFICNSEKGLIDSLLFIKNNTDILNYKSNRSVLKAISFSLMDSVAFFDNLLNR
jgi:glycosyltransferase involved in cell wall biosynthesis